MPQSPRSYSLPIPPFLAKMPGGWIKKVLPDQRVKGTDENWRILPMTTVCPSVER